MCASPSPRPACSLSPAAEIPGPRNVSSPPRAPHSPDRHIQKKKKNRQVNQQDKELDTLQLNIDNLKGYTDDNFVINELIRQDGAKHTIMY